MRGVGIRELKNRLSHYVRLVRSGESVLVTARGEAVAELVPPGTAASRPDLPPGLLALARRGAARLPPTKTRYDYPTLPRVTPAGAARRLLDEDRGPR